ncbi:MAG: ATP-binding cassette domain-containing protein [Desulfurococcales archaeon]|nr:ATP-binding cassette domain-containing protein [Desulfurococcales archaeon]
MLLVVNNLVKKYGKKTAVDSISFTVNMGEIYGLIGPNGAGKTTTLRIIATLLTPTAGSVVVDGIDVTKNPLEVRRRISYLPEEAGAYPYMTGEEYLVFISKLYDPENYKDIAVEAEELSGLGDALKEKIKTYSKGMKRRLQLARSLAVKPRLAILDEPTSGIDVLYSLEIREQIRRYAKQHGITILLSSHNMLEVEDLCDRVAIIYNGKIIAEGTVKEIINKVSAYNLEEAFARLVRHAR